MTPMNRLVAKLLTVALTAGMLSTGCAAPTDTDGDGAEHEAQEADGVTPPSNGVGVGNVHLTVTNESGTPLTLALCDMLSVGASTGCKSRALGSGESIEYTSGGIPGVLGQIVGGVQIVEGSGKVQLLALSAENPLIGAPSVLVGGLTVFGLQTNQTVGAENTCKSADPSLSEGAARTVKCAVGPEGSPLSWQTASAVPVRYRLQRSADSANNTKEMSVTFEQVGPRLVGRNLLAWLQ